MQKAVTVAGATWHQTTPRPARIVVCLLLWQNDRSCKGIGWTSGRTYHGDILNMHQREWEGTGILSTWSKRGCLPFWRSRGTSLLTWGWTRLRDQLYREDAITEALEVKHTFDKLQCSNNMAWDDDEHGCVMLLMSMWSALHCNGWS